MNKSRKVVLFATMVVVFGIGFFSGAVFEQRKRVAQKEAFVNKVSKINPTIEFWREGYLHRDTALQRISDHKDCTFELKSIIGDIY